MKDEIFSKFKDYNKELEKILEKKDFSKDTKNLLLSMFYKLEISYNDYFTVKRKCKSKQDYLENILDNIKQCNSIELIKPADKEFIEFKEQNILYKTDLKIKKIKVIANELALLSSLLELNNFQIYLSEEYNLIRNSIPYLLNIAYEMENVEVLRDFNAWSWNTLISEIKDININLVYQNLRITLGFDLFEKIEKESINLDVIQIIKNKLEEVYNPKTIDNFIELFFKISILIYIKVSQNEKKRLIEEKENIFNDLQEIKNKKLYIENITKQKKELSDNLKEIDIIMNNKDLLLAEYEKRNKLLSEYNKIFSISHLVEKMQRERKKTLQKIEKCNKSIEPKIYIANKNKLQKDYDLVKNLQNGKEENIYKYINKLQRIFLNEILEEKIERLENKNDIIDLVYELRYYEFIPYNSNELIKDINEFTEELESIKEKIVKKMYENKLINTISTNEENDIKIIKNIFELKIINIESIYLSISKKENKYNIKIYDEKETLEEEVELEMKFNKKDKIKLNKKIKLFI